MLLAYLGYVFWEIQLERLKELPGTYCTFSFAAGRFHSGEMVVCNSPDLGGKDPVLKFGVRLRHLSRRCSSCHLFA